MYQNIENEDAMKVFGLQIGRSLKGGEIIELIGDVGAGKTTLTKGIAAGLGVKDDVQSPSFTINRLYGARDGLSLAHYDFYRLNDAGIMKDEISETIGDYKVVTVIEWAEAVSGVLPGSRSFVRIKVTSENGRLIEISGPIAAKIGDRK